MATGALSLILMFGDGSLTFREFLTREPVPLASIQDAVLDFLRGARDVALFGAQAVNAYVDEPRMTQDVDILCINAGEVAERLQKHLNAKFQIAVRIRSVAEGRAYRLYQVQKAGNRQLVDLRGVDSLPAIERIEDVQVVSPPELIALKVISFVARKGQPKAFTDRRDVAALLLRFPNLKIEIGPVREALLAGGADAAVLETWNNVVKEPITPAQDEQGF